MQMTTIIIKFTYFILEKDNEFCIITIFQFIKTIHLHYLTQHNIRYVEKLCYLDILYKYTDTKMYSLKKKYLYQNNKVNLQLVKNLILITFITFYHSCINNIICSIIDIFI